MRRLLTALLIASGGLLDLAAKLPPDRSLAGMKVADGLEVKLFAAEPDLVNPTAIDVDARGRVWVTEAANYRLFRNPLTRAAGDRIRVLEDTDGDGRCDRATTFYQDPKLQAPLGIAVLGSRVYVCQSPDLFYLEDTDGDGRADKRTVVLTGFKGVDHDHAIHGVIFGPDGRLYMSNGDQGLDVTDRSGNRVHVGPNAPHLAASVLRSDLEGERLELLAEGLRNPFEPAVDSFGNVFISDNDDDGNEQCRIVYVMDGGNYGYWPRRRGDRRLDAVHWNEDLPGVVPKILKTGFGSPTGLMLYEGSLLPERLRSTLLHADAGPGVIRSYPLRPAGGAFTTEIRTVLSCPTDKWFRPIDVAAAPDGSLFVADWYDPGVGGHNAGDFTRGRIYRVAPPGSSYRVAPPSIASARDAAAALLSANQATRFLGYQALARDASDAALVELERLAAGSDPIARARALWLLAPRAEAGRRAVDGAMRDPRPELRIQAVRLLAAAGPESLRRAEPLLTDPDAGVRRELLLQLRHVRSDWVEGWVLRLARMFDGQDRFYREALGIAMRGSEERYFSEIARETGGAWDRRFAQIALQLHTPEAVAAAASVLHDAARPAAQRIEALDVVAAGGGDAAAATLVAELSPQTDAAIVARILEVLARDEGREWPAARRDKRLLEFLTASLGAPAARASASLNAPALRASASLNAPAARASASLNAPALRASANQLIRELRLVEFLPRLLDAAADRRAARTARIAALDTIRQLQAPAALDRLRPLLDDPDAAVARAAAGAVAGLGTDGALETLRSILRSPRPRPLRLDVVRLLGASRAGALVLLEMAERRALPQDLMLEAAAVTNASRFESVRLMAAQLLPPPRSRTGKPLPAPSVLAGKRGDSTRGRALFFGSEGPQCARCHRVGAEGRDVGPDLSKIGLKLARQALVESILEPSAAVSHEYQVWLVRTRTRGFLDGYIRAETAEAIDLVDSNGNTLRIPTPEIAARTRSATSLMPSGLQEGMTASQLVDLVEFLSNLK